MGVRGRLKDGVGVLVFSSSLSGCTALLSFFVAPGWLAFEGQITWPVPALVPSFPTAFSMVKRAQGLVGLCSCRPGLLEFYTVAVP